MCSDYHVWHTVLFYMGSNTVGALRPPSFLVLCTPEGLVDKHLCLDILLSWAKSSLAWILFWQPKLEGCTVPFSLLDVVQIQKRVDAIWSLMTESAALPQILPLKKKNVLLKLSERYEFHYMLIIEVIVGDGVILECIILKGVSNALASSFMYIGVYVHLHNLNK